MQRLTISSNFTIGSSTDGCGKLLSHLQLSKQFLKTTPAAKVSDFPKIMIGNSLNTVSAMGKVSPQLHQSVIQPNGMGRPPKNQR
jgi:hypothetical protein